MDGGGIWDRTLGVNCNTVSFFSSLVECGCLWRECTHCMILVDCSSHRGGGVEGRILTEVKVSDICIEDGATE